MRRDDPGSGGVVIAVRNKGKSEVVAFGIDGGEATTWTLGGGEISQVDTYKYLGIELGRKLDFKDYKKRALKQAKASPARVHTMALREGMLKVREGERMWKTLVRPVLEYGAEVWGGDDWEEAEVVQRQMGKRILNVSDYTANEVVMGELGWLSLKARRDMLRLFFWGGW